MEAYVLRKMVGEGQGVGVLGVVNVLWIMVGWMLIFFG